MEPLRPLARPSSSRPDLLDFFIPFLGGGSALSFPLSVGPNRGSRADDRFEMNSTGDRIGERNRRIDVEEEARAYYPITLARRIREGSANAFVRARQYDCLLSLIPFAYYENTNFSLLRIRQR